MQIPHFRAAVWKRSENSCFKTSILQKENEKKNIWEPKSAKMTSASLIQNCSLQIDSKKWHACHFIDFLHEVTQFHSLAGSQALTFGKWKINPYPIPGFIWIVSSKVFHPV